MAKDTEDIMVQDIKMILDECEDCSKIKTAIEVMWHIRANANKYFYIGHKEA